MRLSHMRRGTRPHGCASKPVERYAVLGHPVAHSLSPVLHALFAAQAGRELQYEQIDAPPEGAEAAVQRFRDEGGCGLNVTVPHKQTALQLADRATPRARAAGAANWLAFKDEEISGDNTDGSGLVRDLTATLALELSVLRILLLGAGGAARGVLGPLLECRPRALVLANRTYEKAQALVESHAENPVLSVCALEELEGQEFDLVLNATAAGLAQEALALPSSMLASAEAVCYDFSYGRETPFLAWARKAGCAQVCDGFGMLLEQAAESFELWHGVRPDTAQARAALRPEATRRSA